MHYLTRPDYLYRPHVDGIGNQDGLDNAINVLQGVLTQYEITGLIDSSSIDSITLLSKSAKVIINVEIGGSIKLFDIDVELSSGR